MRSCGIFFCKTEGPEIEVKRAAACMRHIELAVKNKNSVRCEIRRLFFVYKNVLLCYIIKKEVNEYACG